MLLLRLKLHIDTLGKIAVRKRNCKPIPPVFKIGYGGHVKRNCQTLQLSVTVTSDLIKHITWVLRLGGGE